MDASEFLTPAVGPNPLNKRGLIILALDIILLVVLLKFLPYGEKANAGLALMAFVGVFMAD